MFYRFVPGFAAIPCALILGCSGEGIATPPSSGGVNGVGGAGVGGSTSGGGNSPTGGLASNGGVTSTGGVVATGGAVPTGGAQATGGMLATGGSRNETGGAAATGGTTSTGGTKATGSTKSTGGTKTTGGTAGAGGTKATGGTEAAGGSSSTGGSGTSAGGSGGASPGCGSTNTTSPCSKSGSKCTLTVNSKDRTYYVQLPNGYSSSQPCPVIFQFHPWGGTAEQALTQYQLNSRIPNAIFVTPQGVDTGSNGAGWPNSGDEDFAFTKAMIADVEGKYCVDTGRIFSTGFSYGGMMSYAIGCEMSDVFRAIAPMSGAPYSDPDCKGTGHPIAMWASHGASDTFVPTADGRTSRDKILKQNHCGTTTHAVDPSPCVEYEGCDPGYPSIWCEFTGQHTPPSFAPDAIAAFFKQF